MIATTTSRDVRLTSAVNQQLEWDPQFDASAVGVVVKDGVVSLTGYIDSYPGKLAAERAVTRVRGVRAVANDIEVRTRFERTDPDIAADAARALDLRSHVVAGVKAAVHHAYVTLTGEVTWPFQKEAAAAAVRHVRGVRGIHNHIVVRPGAAAHDVEKRIIRAMHREADLEARQITASVADGTVTLGGVVTTFLQRQSAERAAASAPGVARVENRIVVEPITRYSDESDEFC